MQKHPFIFLIAMVIRSVYLFLNLMTGFLFYDHRPAGFRSIENVFCCIVKYIH